MEKLIHRRATAQDSAALTALMRETPMGQSIRTTQDRPDFFSTSRLQADDLEVWAAFEENSGRAAGIFSAGSREVYLDGEIRRVRYLSDLRIRPEYRSGLLLARGFKLLRKEVFAAGEWAQTLVLDDNSDAARLLTSGRGGLPEYRPCGQYRSWFLRGQTVSRVRPDIEIRPAREADFCAMHTLQDQVAPSAAFTPHLDFSAMGGVGFRLAFIKSELVGILGIWNQSDIKTTIVHTYSGALRRFRPTYNLWAKLRNLPRLPSPGDSLSATPLTAVLCRERDPEILRALLSSALTGDGLYAIGLDSSDPLTSALNGLRSHTTHASHYLVGFSGDPPKVRSPFYFDFGRL